MGVEEGNGRVLGVISREIRKVAYFFSVSFCLGFVVLKRLSPLFLQNKTVFRNFSYPVSVLKQWVQGSR